MKLVQIEVKHVNLVVQQIKWLCIRSFWNCASGVLEANIVSYLSVPLRTSDVLYTETEQLFTSQMNKITLKYSNYCENLIDTIIILPA